MKRENIFIIEDEPDILEVLEYTLGREGFSVASSRDGEQGLRQVRKQKPDLLILDLMLPSVDGIEICRRLKSDAATRRVPVLMLTAKSEESDIVLGLGVGADDYMAKPFSPRELVARVKAVLRRGPVRGDSEPGERILRDGVLIDPERHEVQVDGQPVVFTATEFRLLQCLAGSPGRVFTREQLINHAIGEDAIIIDRNVDVHVRSLRKKLESHRDLIETIRGVGYRFRDAEV